MKKKLGYILLSVITIGIVVTIFILPLFNQSKQENKESGFGLVVEGENMPTEQDSVELDAGIIYTGKVVPVESRFYQKDPTKELNQLYVKEGDSVKVGEVLFSYFGKASTNDQINAIQASFHQFKVEQDNWYTQLDQAQKELKGASEPIYIESLQNKIKELEAFIADSNARRSAKLDDIRSLQNLNEDLTITTDIDGFIYKIQNPNANDPSANASAYITILSAKRKVRISVSEYEYPLFKVGATVKVKIESTNQEFDAKITYVDVLPHNINTTDSSYYNVDIDIPQEVPYGYSAIITLPNNE